MSDDRDYERFLDRSDMQDAAPAEATCDLCGAWAFLSLRDVAVADGSDLTNELAICKDCREAETGRVLIEQIEDARGAAL